MSVKKPVNRHDISRSRIWGSEVVT